MKIGYSLKWILFAIAFSFLFIRVFSQQGRKGLSIEFRVLSPDLADTSKVFIAGSLLQLGFWSPSKIQLQNEGNHQWSKTIVVNEPLSIEYKFTLGSWDREAADANGLPLPNFALNVKKDTTVNHSIHFWKKGSSKKIITGKVTGTVMYHRQFKGEGIAPRDVSVWLPPDYNENKNQRYPVVYMHDGQNIFDPATSSFGLDWKIDETCDSLIKNKITEPFLVVGIYNTADRTEEYTPGDGGNAYMKFVVKKLKPFIDSAYQTKSDPANSIVGGSSAGGLISFMLAWEYPSVFSKAICMSPAFKIMKIDYVKAVSESKKTPKNIFFYIDNGGVGLESQLQPGVGAMIEALKQKGFVEGKNYYYLIDPKAKHYESDWARRFPKAISLCFQKK